MWRQVLGADRVGVQDNFFDLGGDSLIAIQAIDLLKGELRLEIPVTFLFEGTTVSSLASLLTAAGMEVASATTPPPDVRSSRRQQLRQKARARRHESAPAATTEQEE